MTRTCFFFSRKDKKVASIPVDFLLFVRGFLFFLRSRARANEDRKLQPHFVARRNSRRMNLGNSSS